MRLRGFDGLRGIAIIGVFMTHKTDWGDVSQYGRTGLWMFFLLCGFLVAFQLTSARKRIANGLTSKNAEIRTFLYKRALRIFPAYYMIIILMAIVWTLQSRVVPGLPFHLTFLSNFYFETIAFASGPETATADLGSIASTWLHYWSLSTEYQFYLLFAPLFIVVGSRYVGQICIAAMVLGIAARLVLIAIHAPDIVILIDTLTSTGLFGAGACIYVYREETKALIERLKLNNAIGAALLVVAFFPSVLVSRYVFGGHYYLDQLFQIGCLGIGALLLTQVFHNQDNIVIRALEQPNLVYLGQISYGFYLYNSYIPVDIPARVISVVEKMAHRGESSLGAIDHVLRGGFLGLAVCFIISYLASHWSWKYFQQPLLDGQSRRAQKVAG